MNKEQFIQRLDELLKDISETERLEAVDYYREYFEDAGEENEQQVIRELGSPEEAAHNIREELSGKELVTTEDSGRAYSRKENTESRDEGADSAWDWEPKKKEEAERKKKNPVIVGLLALAAIFLVITAGIPVVSAVVGIVAGIIAVFFGILLTTWIVGIVFILVSFILFGVAVVNVFAQPIAALLLFGAAFLIFGSGILLVLVGIKLCSVVLPAVIRGIADLGSRIFYRKERVA